MKHAAIMKANPKKNSIAMPAFRPFNSEIARHGKVRTIIKAGIAKPIIDLGSY